MPKKKETKKKSVKKTTKKKPVKKKVVTRTTRTKPKASQMTDSMDDSHMDEMDRLRKLILHREEELSAPEDEFDDDHSGLEVYRRLRFDLCTNCYQQFMQNPISKTKSVKLGFSKN